MRILGKRKTIIAAVLIAITPGCKWTSQVNVSSSGSIGNDKHAEASTSGDGRYVVFSSNSTNLVHGDSNGEFDVFVRDTFNMTTNRVSVSSAGLEADGVSYRATISGDGRYVAFTSAATNLVAGDSNGEDDVFLRDRNAGTTTRVSVDSAGVQGNDSSRYPFVSDDGRYIAFDSDATNLVANDNSFRRDVFLHDRNSGSTTRISEAFGGGDANQSCWRPIMSADSRYIAFHSYATNLVPGGSSGGSHVFVHDRHSGTTSQVDVNNAGVEADGWSYADSISSDGRYIGFHSIATNLVEGEVDPNGEYDAFVRDTINATTTRVSVNNDGTGGDGQSGGSFVSDDGRYALFISHSTNLTASDTNDLVDVFLRDMATNTTSRVVPDEDRLDTDEGHYSPAISADGRYAVYQRYPPEAVPGQPLPPQYSDIYITALHDITVDSVAPNVVQAGTTNSITISGTNFLPDVVPDIVNAQLDNVLVVDENTITAELTVPIGATPGVTVVTVTLPGTGPGSHANSRGDCSDCLTYAPPCFGCDCP